MLILTRKKGEKFSIGENREIVIEILEVYGDQVRVGITAPPEDHIYRGELWDKIFGDKKDDSSQSTTS